MNQFSIGILAGMGPRSTTPFLELVLDQCQAQYNAKYDMDYPHIMIYSLPTPFYIDREIDHVLMKDTIIDGLKKLEATGASIIAMPCNTAHLYFEELKSSINTPLLNIVGETVGSLPNSEQRISMFATEATFNSGLYQRGILAAGHEFIFLDHWQSKINEIIISIKMKRDKHLIVALWNELLHEVKEQDVTGIIIACTDLSVLCNEVNNGIKVYDSSEALATKLVKRYREIVGIE